MKRLILLLVVLACLAAGVAYASIPDSSGVIHGCYTNNQVLRVIDSATQTCAMNETALNWNQTGPQGPAGPTGATGPAGADGAPAIALWAVVSSAGTLTHGSHVVTVTHLSTGTYEVTFDQDVSACGYLVTLAAPPAVGALSTAGQLGNTTPNTSVRVTFTDNGGGRDDSSFSLGVTC
jgi:hypothetical protein